MLTLMTDFGIDSPYVAAMKAAIYERLPQAIVLDLTHAIVPQDIRQGAVVWCDFTKTFPVGTVHLGVVDPDVGGNRRIIATRCGTQYFVCPDNGLLTVILQEHAPVELVEVTEPAYWRPDVSATFHGRDIMAPVAAAIAGGTPLAQLGRAFDADCQPVRFSLAKPTFLATEWHLEILYADHFGNLLLNATVDVLLRSFREYFTDNSVVEIVVGNHRHNATFVRSYCQMPPGRLVLLESSSGRLELAVVNGNALQQLSVVPGDHVIVRFNEHKKKQQA